MKERYSNVRIVVLVIFECEIKKKIKKKKFLFMLFVVVVVALSSLIHFIIMPTIIILGCLIRMLS